MAERAVDADLAPHQLNQRLADRQTQARAAVHPAGRAIDLAEALEQAALLLDGDADTGINDLEPQPVFDLAGLDSAPREAIHARGSDAAGAADHQEPLVAHNHGHHPAATNFERWLRHCVRGVALA